MMITHTILGMNLTENKGFPWKKSWKLMWGYKSRAKWQTVFSDDKNKIIGILILSNEYINSVHLKLNYNKGILGKCPSTVVCTHSFHAYAIYV